jgi:acyl carrier protein
MVLHEATRDRPLDAFVLFSSITALCGLTGTAAYAAGNAALGALARTRRTQGLPALSVLWGTWEGSGMATAAGASLTAQWEAHGIAPFPPATGPSALEALIAADAVEAVAARVDWAKLAGWARQEGSGAELYADLAPAAPIASTPQPQAAAPASGGELAVVVRETVAGILGLAADDPALDRPFGDLGLGSLAAIELRTRLSGRLGIPVPTTLAFNHPSVSAVVRFLSQRMGTMPVAPTRQTPAARIDRMSEAEAERHLATLLADLEPEAR